MMLIVVCGLQGTGKTEVTKLLAEKFGVQPLSTDILRKKQIYRLKDRMDTYNLLFKLAGERLKNKKNVILDGTFYKEGLREKAQMLAKKYKTGLHLIEVICDEKIIKQRIEERIKNGTSASKANWPVYLKYKKLWQPIKERHIVIDNSKDLKWLKKQIEKLTL